MPKVSAYDPTKFSFLAGIDKFNSLPIQISNKKDSISLMYFHNCFKLTKLERSEVAKLGRREDVRE